jgi:hypothetical protein
MQSIVITAASGGAPNLFLRDLTSRKEQRLARSPLLQFPTDVSGRVRLGRIRTAAGLHRAVPVKGDRTMVSSDGGFAPRWRRDGRELYYMSLANSIMMVTVAADGRAGDPKPLFPANRWATFDVMDNGTRAS